jgi:LysR family hydrogen peroxide-inducible transcriptional activator
LPRLQENFPALRLEVRETQTKNLLEELTRGALDCVMLALPAEGADVDSMKLFDDAFLLAAPAADPLPARRPATIDDVDQRRLILLKEGHCLRDQALALCGAPPRDAPARLGATSLATVLQLVANGYGVTLLPEVATGVEIRDSRVKLVRFADPQPGRSVGLAWRRTSPRRRDFEALGEVFRQTIGLIAGGDVVAKDLRRHRARSGAAKP